MTLTTLNRKARELKLLPKSIGLGLNRQGARKVDIGISEIFLRIIVMPQALMEYVCQAVTKDGNAFKPGKKGGERGEDGAGT